MAGRVLVVDDDRAMRALLVDELTERGWSTTGAPDIAGALAQLAAEPVDVLITDLRLAGEDGLALCRAARERDPDLPVLVITAFGDLQSAIAAMRAGAYDFVTKPFTLDALEIAVERAMGHRALKREVARLRSTLHAQQAASALDGLSPPMLALREEIARFADSGATVLLCGESGTGKELVARELHRASRRADKPFVAENLSAIPANLIESALFGHVRGAYTGATGPRDGLFRAAHGGTLLLDEIAELPLELQPKLLRVLEEGRVRPVGADREVAVDVRVVAATWRDLGEAVRAGRFRADLYYRLAVVELIVPPLRERGRDVLLLAQRFVDEHARRTGRDVRGISPAAAARLLAWRWPGNVRELKNAIERAILVASGPEIAPADLPDRLLAAPLAAPEPTGLRSLAEVERRHVLDVLDAVGGNKAEAARVLGIGRKTLYRKLEAWGLDLGRDDTDPRD